MCHGNASASLPTPEAGSPFDGALHGFAFGPANGPRLAILPDIYGCNPFYRGLATHFAAKGMRVFLMNPFHDFGDLPEPSREAAFERRHKLRDKAYMDALERFLTDQHVEAVLGFCLGGLFVFDLARRGYRGRMVAFYPFPQGLPNQDALPVPFDYLEGTAVAHTVLVGDEDSWLAGGVGDRLSALAKATPIDLHVFKGSGHGFLADLDSDDEPKRANAETALRIAETVLLAS